MAEIGLGIGPSHTPILNLGPEDWPRFAELDRVRPHFHKDGRPATYADLLALAEPTIAAEITQERFAARHATVTAAIDRLADELRRAELDTLVVVGDDQHEVFHADNMPGVLIYHADTIPNVPLRTRNPAADWALPPDWSKRPTPRSHKEADARGYPFES